MDISSIINWTWGAITSGAAYDGIKAVLGKSFERLHQHRQTDEREQFDETLRIIFESNDEIRQKLENLAQGKTTNTGNQNITITDGIRGDGNFNNGIFIKK